MAHFLPDFRVDPFTPSEFTQVDTYLQYQFDRYSSQLEVLLHDLYQDLNSGTGLFYVNDGDSVASGVIALDDGNSVADGAFSMDDGIA